MKLSESRDALLNIFKTFPEEMENVKIDIIDIFKKVKEPKEIVKEIVKDNKLEEEILKLQKQIKHLEEEKKVMQDGRIVVAQETAKFMENTQKEFEARLLPLSQMYAKGALIGFFISIDRMYSVNKHYGIELAKSSIRNLANVFKEAKMDSEAIVYEFFTGFFHIKWQKKDHLGRTIVNIAAKEGIISMKILEEIKAGTFAPASWRCDKI